MSRTLTSTPGRSILTFIGLITATAPFIADWSHTHVFNPKWTPHAKFHNGQTMSMGFCLGLATLYYTWQTPATRMTVGTATFLGVLYYVTGLSAASYPGAMGRDEEFGGGNPQYPLFGALGMLAGLGGWLEMRRVG